MVRAIVQDRRNLPFRYFYTPRNIYTGCVGITANVNASSFPDRIRFRVDVREEDAPIRLFTDLDGVAGLMDLKRQLLDLGFGLPEAFGEVEPFDLHRIEVKSRSIAIRLPDTFVTKSDRVYLKYNETFGSFNSTVYSARSLLASYSKMATILRLQRDIINQSDGLSRIDPKLLLDYTKLIHDPDVVVEED